MAQSPLANDPGERYAELERAYTEARWPDVLEQGGLLLADLDTDPDPVSADLASRANLLLGHAHLYGLRDPAAALPHYQAVLAGPADPDLRRIVEEALPYCQSAAGKESSSPVESAVEAIGQESATAAAATAMFNATATEDAAPSAQERSAWAVIEPTADPLGEEILDRGDQWIPRAGTAAEAITESATPWLDQPIQVEPPISLEKAGPSEVGGALAVPAADTDPMPPTLEVEVVEEPELVEVAQADPSLAEELEIELTRIKERRAASRVDAEAGQQLVASTPAPEPTPTPEPAAALPEQADLDQLMNDPELLAGLLRVVVRP